MGIIPSAAAKVAQVTINGSPVKKTVTAVSFNGDKVTIHFDDDNTTDADMGDVLLSFADGNSSTAVDLVNSLSIFRYEGIIGETMTVSGIQENSNLTVYDITGKTVLGPVATESRMEINVSGLTPGVYVLRAGKDVVKFVKR